MLTEEGKQIAKGWGHEEIIFSNEHYALKRLVFGKKGSKFSMHFHMTKKESWVVEHGSFRLRMHDLSDASVSVQRLYKGDRVTINPLQPHQLIALQAGSVILEVSTADHVEDSYRIKKGDSQK